MLRAADPAPTTPRAADRAADAHPPLQRRRLFRARHPLSGGLLNVNVPDVPRSELKGFQVTRLGRRHKAEDMIKSKSPRGETIYWVGAAGAAADAGAGTDFRAVEECFVSITPLQIDLTNRDLMPPVAAWIER